MQYCTKFSNYISYNYVITKGLQFSACHVDKVFKVHVQQEENSGAVYSGHYFYF